MVQSQSKADKVTAGRTEQALCPALPSSPMFTSIVMHRVQEKDRIFTVEENCCFSINLYVISRITVSVG